MPPSLCLCRGSLNWIKPSIYQNQKVIHEIREFLHKLHGQSCDTKAALDIIIEYKISELSPDAHTFLLDGVDGFTLSFLDWESRQHVIMSSSSGLIQFWLEPCVELANNNGLEPSSVDIATEVIEKHLGAIQEVWELNFWFPKK